MNQTPNTDHLTCNEPYPPGSDVITSTEMSDVIMPCPSDVTRNDELAKEGLSQNYSNFRRVRLKRLDSTKGDDRKRCPYKGKENLKEIGLFH